MCAPQSSQRVGQIGGSATDILNGRPGRQVDLRDREV